MVFAAISAVSWVDPEPGVTPVELALDFALSLFSVLGMVFYATRTESPRVAAAWKVVAPLIILGYIVRFALAWPELAVPEPGFTVMEHTVLCVWHMPR